MNKQANSVELPTAKASGQYRAKRSEMNCVCNEQVLAPKGMVCSELHRNMKTIAEMTIDALKRVINKTVIMPVNQTAKVAYILWRGNMCTMNRRRHFKLTGITA